ncbi:MULTISPECIES: 6-phosphofructokinase [unclassified Zunongwangia]|uniref:6-phosphofructokinase n=1 Tax=unclassified Zunongwangia TaxID=2632541 RepID=UPI0022DE474B|nr:MULTISPECIES: 6-phosphofructokinase [unclassified Zunongwangia]WBL21280.1 6-phosphofructokinase [Zunongwangia sp. HRR-M8]WBL26862.1 6-phosphofructokinase [Zunongwangia sp. HGR-M22]
MANKIKKIGVLTSGGDAPGMNAAIRAVVRACSFYKIDCVGVYRGYQGLMEGDFEELNARSVRNVINKGGTFLKSARSMEFKTKEGRKRAYEQLTKNNIDALVVIGGDGTFTGGIYFSQEFDLPIVGIPATIDNDISGTDFTLGYDTALNTVVEAIDKIRDTASSHNRLFFIEVMGRDAGDIALNSGIGAGAEEILIPEEDEGLERMLESLRKSKMSGKLSSIIVVAEGEKSGKNIFQLAEHVEEQLEGYDIRVSVLGHIQRGGRPSCFDRVLASKLGVGAVEALIDGDSKVMIGLSHQKVVRVPLTTAINGEAKYDKELRRVADITSV